MKYRSILLLAFTVAVHANIDEAMLVFQKKLGEIAQKYQDKVPPKGNPFPTINGPKSKNAKIGVVGAGPGGVHMAWELKRRGFGDVTILEKSDRIGGKSDVYMHRGIPQFVSTIIIQPNYKDAIVPLLEEFDLNLSAASTYSALTESNMEGKTVNMIERLAISSMEHLNIKDPAKAIEAFMEALDRYISLHKEMFGDYKGTIPLRPDADGMKRLDGTFGEFFERNNLTILYPFMYTIYSNYGFGFTDDVSAYYPIITADPENVIGILRGEARFTIGPGGYTKMFELMVEREAIEVKYHTDVQSLKKLDNGQIRVTANDNRDKYDFDFLIWGGTLSDFGQNQENIIVDEDEKKLFSETEEYFISSSVVNMKNSRRDAPHVYYWDTETLNPDNEVYSDVDAAPFGVSTKDYKNRNYQVQGGADLNTVTCYQMNQDNSKPNPTRQQLQDKIREHYTNLEAEDIEILQTWSWPKYFSHWKTEASNKGSHWDLFDIQGRDNVMWVGAGPATGEYLKAVIEYNQLIMRQIEMPGSGKTEL